jgi:diadenosine tetraphosphate (Ap4A) HIT family hydrolase
MSTVKECPFCNLSDRSLKENKHAKLFLSDPRKVEGHFLVVPKRHIEKPWEMTEEELVCVFELVHFIQKRIVETMYGGADIRENYRPFMKQGKIKVDHIHYHIYPRQNEDELYNRVEKFEREMFVALPDVERERVLKLVGLDK